MTLSLNKDLPLSATGLPLTDDARRTLLIRRLQAENASLTRRLDHWRNRARKAEGK
jgi:hypothetical protein